VNVGASQAPEWQLVTDIGITRFLRAVSDNARAKHLGMSLATAVETGLQMEVPFICFARTPVSEALSKAGELPIVVVQDDSKQILARIIHEAR